MGKEKISRFEDFEVWKESMRLVTDIYHSLKTCSDYGFRDQMQRASVSIPSNIAEGFERQSNREFLKYLFIAKGSCAELRTQLYLARQIKIIPEETAKQFIEKTKKISAMLSKLIATRKFAF